MLNTSPKRIVAVVTFLCCLAILAANTQSAQAQSTAPAVVKVLEQPRFHSLKSDRVNVRRGPGLQYPILWIFRRVGLPVEVIREFDNWWQIRDSEGAQGWVYKGLLAYRRTVLLAPWAVREGNTESIALRIKAERAARVVAFAEPGTIASVRRCDGRWCQVIIEPYQGWVPQKQLWGVYERESIKP